MQLKSDHVFQAHDRLGTLYLRVGDTEQAKVTNFLGVYGELDVKALNPCFTVGVCCCQRCSKGAKQHIACARVSFRLNFMPGAGKRGYPRQSHH